MKNYGNYIGQKIVVAQGEELWNMNTWKYEWFPISGVLTGFRKWTDDFGDVTWWATINGHEINVTNKSFKLAKS